jgi:hypothetical protein
MVVIFDAVQGFDNFRCVRDGQSYYLTYLDTTKFSISRFESGRWTAKEYDIPSQGLERLVISRSSFLLGDTFVVFFFTTKALFFSLMRETFRTIKYRNLGDIEVASIYRTKNFYFFNFRSDPEPLIRSQFIPINALEVRNYIEFVAYSGHITPMPGDNDVVIGDGFIEDIRDNDRFRRAHFNVQVPIAIFDPQRAILYRQNNGATAFYIGEKYQPYYGIKSIYFDINEWQYIIDDDGLRIKRPGEQIKNIDFRGISRVFVDKNIMFLMYGSTKILALDLNDLDRYRFISVSNRLGKILSQVDFGVDVFVNGHGLPQFNPESRQLSPLESESLTILGNLDESIDLFLVGSEERSDGNIHWVTQGQEISTPNDHVIFDLDTGMFL